MSAAELEMPGRLHYSHSSQVGQGFAVADELTRTVRIVRRSKVTTDDRGRTVWVDPIETADLELVSTAMLKRLISSDDESKKQQLRDAAAGKDGVLAHDAERGSFEIIDDDDLKAILESEPKGMEAIKAADAVLEPLASQADTDDEELSLVSTQALRQLLDPDATEAEDSDTDGLSAGARFDPYNSS